jgi:predicted metal-dependent enzyme (double-stranded beta helix superfamily)
MFRVDAFVADVQRCLAQPDPLPAVAGVLRAVVAEPEAIEEALRARSGARSALGFDVFCRRPDLTIFQATLAPRFRNPLHDHGTWAMVAVYRGTERNIFYRRAGHSIVEERRIDATAPQVVTMPPGVIHAIENPLPAPSHAIHVYGNDHFDASRSMWHPETLEEQPHRMDLFLEWTRAMTGDRR